MKCRLMRHFIWIFTVCCGTHLRDSSPPRIKERYSQTYIHRVILTHIMAILKLITLHQPKHEISNNVLCDQQRLRSACVYAQTDQSLCKSLEYSMSVKLLTEHHWEFLSLTGGCTGSSETTLVKMPHCWKSHVKVQICLATVHCILILNIGNGIY